MNKREYLMTVLSEECAEIIQCISKIQRFGLNSKNPRTLKTNNQHLVDELNDMMAVLNMLTDNGVKFDGLCSHELIENKINKVNQYIKIFGMDNV